MAGMAHGARVGSTAWSAGADGVMPHLVSVPLNSDNDPSEWRRAPYRVEVAVRDGRVDVCLHGEVDAAAAHQLRRDLEPLGVTAAAICVDLSRVTFLDSNGIEPFVELVRSHAARGLPPVQVSVGSPVARRLLTVGRPVGDPELIVRADDQVLRRPVRSRAIDHRLHLTPSAGHHSARRR